MNNAATYQIEQSIIGSIFIRPDNLSLLPDLEPGHFADWRGRLTFQVIRNLEATGFPIDITTVGDELARIGKLDSVGWGYLGECGASMPTLDNAIEYARRLKDHALHTKVAEMAGEIIRHAKSGEMGGAELLTLALAELSKLDAEQPERAFTIGEVVKRRVHQLEAIARARANGEPSLTGIPTGIDRLDEKMGGWPVGIVSIVAARPGHGKSSLGLATADSCTAKGYGAHVFSLEDTASAYADRSVARDSGVSAESLRNAEFQRGDMQPIAQSMARLGKRKNWMFDDRSGITAQEIVRSVRRHRKDNGTRVVIVDYIQLVRPPHSKHRISTHEALSETITAFADAAKQDGLAYVVMSQLNREIEKRPDKRPQLSDLRESGSLEERAKCVVGLYRGAAYQGSKPVKGIDYPEGTEEPSLRDWERMVQLIVLKNSNGRTGTVHASWFGATTRIE